MGAPSRALFAMTLDVRARFDDAAARATKLPKPPTETQVRLYGLFKQAKSAAPAAGPSAFSVVAHKKWQAWRACRDLSPEGAMEAYCELVASLEGRPSAPAPAPPAPAAPAAPPAQESAPTTPVATRAGPTSPAADPASRESSRPAEPCAAGAAPMPLAATATFGLLLACLADAALGPLAGPKRAVLAAACCAHGFAAARGFAPGRGATSVR